MRKKKGGKKEMVYVYISVKECISFLHFQSDV